MQQTIPTILIVEDEPSVADNMTYALASHGFQPIWSQTGAEALAYLQTETVALILLDIGLPDVNGFELAKTIRRQSSVPVIFVTARSDEVDRVVGLEIGADDYVVKPFSPRELTARVKAVLRRTAQPPSAAVSADPPAGQSPAAFQLDTARHRITYWGVPLNLSRYEFRLCKVLLSHPGRVYSRDELMELIWESPEMSLDRTVDTHIKTLRQKMRTVRPDIDPIVTHRGVGYALRESW